jgi:hypothetical protein
VKKFAFVLLRLFRGLRSVHERRPSRFRSQPFQRLRFTLLTATDHLIRPEPRLCWLRPPQRSVAAGIHTLRIPGSVSVCGCACRLGVLTCDRPAGFRSNRSGEELQASSLRPGSMNTRFGVTDPPLLRFLIHAAQVSRGACLVSKGGQPSDARLGTNQITVLLEMADALGSGSFGDVSSHEMTRLPSSTTFRRGCDRCNRSRHARRRSSHVERRRLDFVPSVRIMHRRVLCRRGVPLRGPDIHGLAGR